MAALKLQCKAVCGLFYARKKPGLCLSWCGWLLSWVYSVGPQPQSHHPSWVSLSSTYYYALWYAATFAVDAWLFQDTQQDMLKNAENILHQDPFNFWANWSGIIRGYLGEFWCNPKSWLTTKWLVSIMTTFSISK